MIFSRELFFFFFLSIQELFTRLLENLKAHIPKSIITRSETAETGQQPALVKMKMVYCRVCHVRSYKEPFSGPFPWRV